MIAFSGFPKETIAFLSGLSRNNEKAWFDAHREDYDRYFMEPAKAFVFAIGEKLPALSGGLHAEPRVNGSIFRINRDVRFSKDKSPYRDHLDLWFWDGPEKSWACSGFFFRLKPKGLLLGAGMHHFDKDVLARYRAAVADPKKGARLVAAAAAVTKASYDVGGAEYKKPPRGFTADGPRAPFLLHAALYAGWEGPHPKALHSAAFVDFCVGHFKKLLPLHRWLTDDVLTT